MKILFASPEWKKFKTPLRGALLESGINHKLVFYDHSYYAEDIEFIIYSPDSTLRDFAIFKNLKAVLSLWAGVDEILENNSLKKPLVRLIDPGMKQGMLEWCATHVLRHHLSIDKYILNDKREWHLGVDPPLASERTIGILGLGELGDTVANTLVTLGFNVSGWAKSVKREKLYNQLVGRSGFEEVLSSSDILVLLLPLTPETKFIINEHSLRLMKDNSVILNAGRGKLINDRHLLAALAQGKISHATLDVFSEEPLPQDHPYWANKNVTVSPHVAAPTRPETAAHSIASNIKRMLSGESPVGLVKKQKFY